MSASLGLFRLQQVDSQIDRTRTRLDAIQKTLENDAELRTVKSRFETSNDENLLALHNAANAENEANGLKIKIEQAEASLYSGSIKNPKELQDLQKDIASLKKHLVTLEERQLDAMLQTETTGAELEKAKTDLALVQSRLGNEHKKLLDEQTELLSHLDRLGREREAAVTPIDSPLLATYEDLRKQKRGVAVTEVDDDACTACGTTINASLKQNARSQKQLAHCPSCGRILFAN